MMGGKCVLLVATATKWLAAARMPSALSRAGFEVALLAPRGSLAEKSRYLAKVGYLADNATPLDWVYAFAAMVKATSPTSGRSVRRHRGSTAAYVSFVAATRHQTGDTR